MAVQLPWERGAPGALAARMAIDSARQIVEGRYRSGLLLTEADLAQAAGASRTPAREAMLRLEAWGLVRLAPKKGAIVTAMTARERSDLLSVRAMLEVAAADALARDAGRLAALNGALQTALARQRIALDAQDTLAFAGADYAFHAHIILSTGNEVVAAICDQLGPRLAWMTYTVVSERPESIPDLLTEHEELTTFLARGDAPGFAARIREHIATGHAPNRFAP